MQRLNPDGASDRCRELRHSLDSSCDNICALDFAISHPSDWRMRKEKSTTFSPRGIFPFGRLYRKVIPYKPFIKVLSSFPHGVYLAPALLCGLGPLFCLVLIVVLSFHLLYLFTFPLKLIRK